MTNSNRGRSLRSAAKLVLAAAIVLVPLCAPRGVARAESPIHAPFRLVGTTVVSGFGVTRRSSPITFTASVYASTFSLDGLSAYSVFGTTANSADGKKSDLTVDPTVVGGLAAGFEAALVATFPPPHTIQVAAVGGSGVLRWGETRAARKLTAKLSFNVSLDGGRARRLSVQFKCSGFGRRVLLLDDGASDAVTTGDELQPALEKAGHFVMRVGPYETWDGLDPQLADFDVVLLCQRFSYSPTLTTAADQALVAWSQSAGHGLVRMEWSAYQAHFGPIGSIDDALPVVSPDGAFARSSTWSVVPLFKKHPLVRKLPKRFRQPRASNSVVQAGVESDVVAVNETGIPMISVRAFGQGICVHINHANLESTPEPKITKPILQAFVNAVEFSAP